MYRLNHLKQTDIVSSSITSLLSWAVTYMRVYIRHVDLANSCSC
jgi:hypothetical protein